MKIPKYLWNNYVYSTKCSLDSQETLRVFQGNNDRFEFGILTDLCLEESLHSVSVCDALLRCARGGTATLLSAASREARALVNSVSRGRLPEPGFCRQCSVKVLM